MARHSPRDMRDQMGRVTWYQDAWYTILFPRSTWRNGRENVRGYKVACLWPYHMTILFHI